MEKVIVYEPWAKNNVHYEFIKNFILSLSYIYKEIVFYGHESIICLLKKDLIELNICFVPISLVNCETLFGKITCLNKEKRNISLIKRNNSTNYPVFVTCGMPYTFFCFRKVLNNAKVYYVLHGGLEVLENPVGIFKLMHYLVSSIRKLPDNSKIIVLGNSIRKNFLHYFPNFDKRIFAIDLPCSKIPTNNETNVKSENIKIGSIGIAQKEKGNYLLKDLALFVQEKKLNIGIYHVGKMFKDLFYLEKFVYLPLPKEGLASREDFSKAAMELDYFLYFYDKSKYKLTASGALFDAFIYRKPIIALRNDYFEDIFNRFPGIGYLCDNFDEMKEKLLSLPANDSFEYKNMQDKETEALLSFDPKIISEQIRINL